MQRKSKNSSSIQSTKMANQPSIYDVYMDEKYDNKDFEMQIDFTQVETKKKKISFSHQGHVNCCNNQPL